MRCTSTSVQRRAAVTALSVLLLLRIAGRTAAAFLFSQFEASNRVPRLRTERRQHRIVAPLPFLRTMMQSKTDDANFHHEHDDDDDDDDGPFSMSTAIPSAFQGAGSPRPTLDPSEIPTLLTRALELNDFPRVNAGLESMWAFAGDTTRHIFQQNKTAYMVSAHETADTFPTSFYGAVMHGQSWETNINRVGGENGWIATQVLKTVTSDGRIRRWQWELRKKKRPPDLGCWFVESIGSSDRKGQFEPE